VCGGWLCPFPWGEELGLHVTQYRLGRGLPPCSKWHLDPSSRLATIHQRYRQTGQRHRSTGRTVTSNGRPKTVFCGNIKEKKARVVLSDGQCGTGGNTSHSMQKYFMRDVLPGQSFSSVLNKPNLTGHTNKPKDTVNTNGTLKQKLSLFTFVKSGLEMDPANSYGTWPRAKLPTGIPPSRACPEFHGVDASVSDTSS